jgi:hypothetical protein
MAKGFNVSDFRSRLSRDGARPSLFSVNISSPRGITSLLDADKLSFLCKASSLPASTVGEKVISYFGHDVHFAGNRTFEDWTVTVYNDEDFSIRNSFESWMNAIDKHSGAGRDGIGVSPSEYVTDATVTQYGKQGDTLKEYKFKNLWPSSIAAITVDWDTKDDIETFDVTFKYDWYDAVKAGGALTTS